MQFLSLLVVTVLSAESLALRVQQGTRSLPVAEDRIDLVPPKFESISQYNQPQTLSQVLGIQQHSFIQPIMQQQGPIAPFLYLGPLLYSSHQKPQQQRAQEAQKESTEDQEENTYVIYRPSHDDELVDLSPPPIKQEQNYYSTKPRKFKKYQEENKKSSPKSVDDLKKRIKIAEIESADDELEPPKNLNSEEIHRTLDENIRVARDLLTAASRDDYEIKESPPTSRLDFQMHGYKGPNSYKFGYDTGEDEAKGNNRQFRVEERASNGDVVGRYGYYDRKGKLRVVNYASTAKDGFKIL